MIADFINLFHVKFNYITHFVQIYETSILEVVFRIIEMIPGQHFAGNLVRDPFHPEDRLLSVLRLGCIADAPAQKTSHIMSLNNYSWKLGVGLMLFDEGDATAWMVMA
ncbi:hypothetical protein ACJX0J_031485, partial [Zea mays]